MTVLFPRHLTPQRMPDVISHIQTFRDYFHYHIKASKVCVRAFNGLWLVANRSKGIYPLPYEAENG